MNTPQSMRLTPLLMGISAGLLLAGLLHGGSVHAASPEAWQQYNERVLKQHILPGYQQFASSSAALSEQIDALCATPTETTLQQAQQGFGDALQAWQGVAHIQFGPVQTLMRNFSIQYWPDRKNIGQRQLDMALATPAYTAFDQPFFHQASISIKGLPALERLLFDQAALSKIQQQPRYCELTAAIGDYLDSTAAALLSDWLQNPPDLAASANEDEEGDATLPAFSLNLMKSLVEPIELIRDTKLLAVLGQDAQSTRPMRAESWRSQQSLSNIHSNVKAARALYYAGTGVSQEGVGKLLRAAGQDALESEIQNRFRELEAQLEQLPDSLVQTLASPEGYTELRNLTQSLRALDNALNQAMDALNIHLGFNSRDGD